jgi:hypothetical protein
MGHGQAAIFWSAILLEDSYRFLSARASLVEILSQSRYGRPPLRHLTMPDFALIPGCPELSLRDNL